MLTSALFLFLFFVLQSGSAIPGDQVAPIVHAILQSAGQMLESMTFKDINKLIIFHTQMINTVLYVISYNFDADKITSEISNY